MAKTRVFVEIPTWLGDAVMTTPAIENIIKTFEDVRLSVFGSFVSTRLFVNHPSVETIIVDESKKSGNRYLNLYRYAKEANQQGDFEYAFSFRKNFTTQFLLFFIKAQQKYRYKRYTKKPRHQVLRYNDFINHSLAQNSTPGELIIYTNTQKNKQKQSTKPLLGINPGATYGSAKRWYPSEFAKVAIALASEYDTIIFGGPGEKDIANDIQQELDAAGVKNYTNLAGKTSIQELIENISRLCLFITNDSGPMHVAAAFQVPTVAIFGPTNHTETHQWNNPDEIIVKKELECAPCMKRVCPLGTHECMKQITAQDVLQEIENVK